MLWQIRGVVLAEASSLGHTILTYAPESRGTLEYLSQADEALERLYIGEIADTFLASARSTAV